MELTASGSSLAGMRLTTSHNPPSLSSRLSKKQNFKQHQEGTISCPLHKPGELVWGRGSGFVLPRKSHLEDAKGEGWLAKVSSFGAFVRQRESQRALHLEGPWRWHMESCIFLFTLVQPSKPWMHL